MGLARIETLHAPRPWHWMLDGDSRNPDRSDRCNHCRWNWPCPTLIEARSDDAGRDEPAPDPDV